MATNLICRIISLISGLAIIVYAGMVWVNTIFEFIPSDSSTSRVAYLEEREFLALLFIGIALIVYSILSITIDIQGDKACSDDSETKGERKKQ